jgi:phosphoglycolate phosphatase-like HAD superfamily hydrolase
MREQLRTLIGGIESTVGPGLPDDTELPPVFFGRGRDLDELRGVLNVVRSTGQCRSVTLVGTAGLGKSRLLEEFARAARLLDEPQVRVFCSAAKPNGSPWSCFTQLLAQRFGLAEANDLEQAKASVRSQVADVLDDRKVGDVLYLLGDLLELEFPQSPITKALEDGAADIGTPRRVILKSLVEADAAFGPICFVFDDLHLCHPQSLSMLRYLIEHVSGPVMFLSAARPELFAHPEGPSKSDRHSLHHLSPLGEVDTIALIGSLLSSGGFTPLYLIEQAREVTGGNPGRIESTARFYRERGTLPPASSADEISLESRTSQLSPDERLLLQRATVMGGVFWLGALVVLDRSDRLPPASWAEYAVDLRRVEIRESLEQLAERDYIMRLPDSTFAGDEEYVFKHRQERAHIAALTNPDEARQWHRTIADWLDGQAETRTHEEYLELLAEQRNKAGEIDGAAMAYREAAECARSHRSAKRELVCLDKALALLPDHGGARRLDLLLRSSALLERQGAIDTAVDRYREASVLAYRLDRRDEGTRAERAARALELGRVDSVVFDLDGTLWDTCAACAIGWNNVARKHGVAFREVTAEDVRSVTGRPHAACIREIFVGVPEEQLVILAEETQAEDMRIIEEMGGRVFPGVAEGLARLAARFPLYIVSNCQSGYIERFLSLTGFAPHFKDHECWGNTGRSKTENLRTLVERNRLRRPILVGDTAGDEKAALDNGMPFAFASYGFGACSRMLITVGAFEELADLLLR